jgi:putative SOS response-associated peptidase YedK
MCARVTLFSTPETVAAAFQLEEPPPLQPRYNIAPSQPVPVVRLDRQGRREFVHLRWGLIPSWANDPSLGQRLINARAETAAEKPAFRTALARRRCLVAVDGFYEWHTAHGKKHPLHFARPDHLPFALAGLWEHWQSPDGEKVESCTILTTRANELLAPFHDRMPVILRGDEQRLWLDEASTPGMLQGLFQPVPVQELMATPASTRVNNPRNEGADCLVPTEGEGLQPLQPHHPEQGLLWPAG